MAAESRGWRWALGQLIWRNWITLFGSSITTVSAGALLVFFGMGIAGIPLSPYIGILTYLILPGLFVFGLLLIPFGAWIDRRRRRAVDADVPAHIDIDFNSPRVRKLTAIVAVLTFMNFVIISAVSYEGAVYMESVEFCGETCHTVMEPEFTAHMDSPHSNVKCVECHIGPGLPSVLHAKLNGLNQVYGVLTGDFERPVPTPVHGMADAELTCGECHAPEEDLGSQLRVTTAYMEDEANTPLSSVLMMHIGGRGASSPGAHTWHMKPGREVYYYAADEKRETISYVKVTEADGTEVEYFVDGADVDPATLAPEDLRRMDCIDCHNRPTHTFDLPGPALDAALAGGAIDAALPSIKTAGLAALQGAAEADDGPSHIAESVNAFYTENFPDGLGEKQQTLDEAIAALQDVYRRNVFPAMNVTWGTYPNHNGHTQFTGCFRCHDDGHASADGARVISQDCTVCHNVITWQEENPEILGTLGLQ